MPPGRRCSPSRSEPPGGRAGRSGLSARPGRGGRRSRRRRCGELRGYLVGRCPGFRLQCRHRRTTAEPGSRRWVRAQPRADAQRALGHRAARRRGHAGLGATRTDTCLTVAFDRRLERLRALLDRIERLPASAQREWMLEEVRSRLVDIETGVEPHPMRTLPEETVATPLEPSSQVTKGRVVKRSRSKPVRAAASPRLRSRTPPRRCRRPCPFRPASPGRT